MLDGVDATIPATLISAHGAVLVEGVVEPFPFALAAGPLILLRGRLLLMAATTMLAILVVLRALVARRRGSSLTGCVVLHVG